MPHIVFYYVKRNKKFVKKERYLVCVILPCHVDNIEIAWYTYIYVVESHFMTDSVLLKYINVAEPLPYE